MWKHTLFMFFCIFCSSHVVSEGGKHKPPVDWWCDETECFYSETVPEEYKCESNNTIPYRFNSTTGTCELNLVGLLLSFRVLNNRLGAVVEAKNQKRSEIIFQGIINSGKVFTGFASLCVFVGCFYCYWVQYSDRRLRKSVKAEAKKIQTQPTNKHGLNFESKENKEIVKTQKYKTKEIQVSVV